MVSRKNRINVIVEQVALLKNYLDKGLERTEEQVMQDLYMKKITLYRLLANLANDPVVCINGKFPIIGKSQSHLTLKEVESFLNKQKKNRVKGPKSAERILYLYHILHANLPYGGVTMQELKNNYLELIEKTTGGRPTDLALSRMIYRDLLELEQIGIVIDRPSTGGSKYCLHDRYLPKISSENAAAIYISMLLYQDTLLDKAVNCVKSEMEKAFFRDVPEKINILAERIHIVGDKLAHPEEFGDNLGKIVRALLNNYELIIDYIKVNGEVSERVVYPLGLVYKRSVWYMVAWDPGRDDFRTFRADQIINIGVNERKQFSYPEGFIISEYIGDSWGVFCDDPVQVIRLRFSPAVAYRVKKLLYHPSQKVIQEDREGLVVEFKVCGFKELLNWVLQWGPEVEVLTPEKLRQQVMERAQQVLELYR
ncbi:MAG: helix-turn-helix transcriptional regulator [Syntrophomonadaceae bacterium]|jgi:predicted DNA-binding transcriptional regulator YafY